MAPGGSVVWTYEVTNIGPVDIPEADISVTDIYELRSVKWLINMHDEVLGDLAVRTAIQHAIDYDLAINSVLGEAGRPMHGYVPDGFSSKITGSGWAPVIS